MGRQWLWFALPAAATVGLFVVVAVFGGGLDDDEPSVPTVAATTPREEAVEPEPTATTSPRPRTQTTATTRTTTRGTGTTREQRRGQTAQVPDFRALTEERAVARVKAAGFQAAVRRVRSFQPDGTVIEQRPRPGVRAIRGRTVMLVVSVLKPRIPPPQRTETPPPPSS
jgi:hypothetical protein